MKIGPPALIGLISDLRELGADASLSAEITQSSTVIDALLRVDFDGLERTFAIEQRRRPPRRGELEQVRRELAKHGAPLLLCPRVEPGLARELARTGWSWADDHGNFYLQAPGLRLSRSGQARSMEPNVPKLPRGPAGRRLLRWLISAYDETEPISTTDLAKIIGVSQAAVSQIVTRLRANGLVGASRGLAKVDREALLHEFVRQYPGAGGRIVHAYSLEPPATVAQQLMRRPGPSVAISADVGPDMLVPWRAPTTLIVYAHDPIALDRFDLVEADGPSDANVVIHYPTDDSVFVDYVHPKRNLKLLADPTQMYIDLVRLGGEDRLEAAEKLETWILK